VPYLHCQRCRITVYKPTRLAQVLERCPRCGARLATEPRKLFQHAPDGPQLSAASRALTAQLEKVRAVRKSALRDRGGSKRPKSGRGTPGTNRLKPGTGRLKPT
jgi:hypothetical protein